MTSTESGNGIGSKSSMLRPDRQIFVAPGTLARGRGKKLHELYASKSQTTLIGRSMNSQGEFQSSTSIGRSTDISLMRGSSVGASSGDRDPFNPTRHLSGCSSRCLPYSPVHRDVVEDDGDDADNNDDDATLSDDDVEPSSEDEDMHIPRHVHSVTHELRDSATERTQPECDNEIETLQNEEELNDGEIYFFKYILFLKLCFFIYALNLFIDGVSKRRKSGNRSAQTRGKNKCKEIAKLKPGEKIPIQFYRNRAVGDNYDTFVRHLGIIVRDTNICPLRVHRWKDIDTRQLEHMWQAVTV